MHPHIPLQLTFVRGTDFQLTKEYTTDVYKIGALVTFASMAYTAAQTYSP